MTPQEILEQAVNSINCRVSDVKHSMKKYCYLPYGAMPDYGKPFYERVEHAAFKTREYNDYGCAVYKLIRYIEAATSKAKMIFWRRAPTIMKHIDFKTGGFKYSGVARFSVQNV